jgi:hypothetical protein
MREGERKCLCTGCVEQASYNTDGEVKKVDNTA